MVWSAVPKQRVKTSCVCVTSFPKVCSGISDFHLAKACLLGGAAAAFPDESTGRSDNPISCVFRRRSIESGLSGL